MNNPWTVWAAQNGIAVPSEDDPPDCDIESDSMLLNREDADLFGLCPAWDEFYLVHCDECQKVLKPMALKHHIEIRHSRSSRSPSTTSSEMSVEASNSKTFFKYHSSSNSSTASSVGSGRNKCSSGVKVKLTMAAQKDSSREREVSLSRSQNSQDNSSYICPSTTKEDSEQSSSSSSSVQSPTDAAKNLDISGTVSSSGINSRSRSPLIADERSLLTPVVALTKASIVGMNSANCCLHSSERTTQGDSLKRPFANVPDNSMAPNKKKFLPCKDREYDPNKHCGVIASDTGKPCTRSLTCKTHSLSLRRGVPGRLKGFDDLLAENRAAKEQKPLLGLSIGDVAPHLSPRPLDSSHLGLAASPSIASGDGAARSSPGPEDSHLPLTAYHSPTPSLAPALLQQQSSPTSSRSASPAQVVLASPDGKLTLPLIRPASPPPPPPQLVRHDPGPPLAQQLAQTGVAGLGVAVTGSGMNSLLGAGCFMNISRAGVPASCPDGLLSTLRSAALPARPLAVPSENPGHNVSAGVQPKPAALCTFGMRVLSSSNVVLLDRRWDATRGALAAALSPQMLPTGQTSLLINRQSPMTASSSLAAGCQQVGQSPRRRVRTAPGQATSPKQIARKILSTVRVGVAGISGLSMVAPSGQMPPAQLTAGQ